jgi:tetratricopeptide (TPR) repeat protein
MPTEVFEDAREFLIGLLEAEPVRSGDEPGYPQPSLSLTGRRESRTFRTLILENDHLRATLLPDLGGRLISLFDKRTGVEILEPVDQLDPKPGGPRGVSLPAGSQIRLQGQDRLNALGPVAFASEPARDEDGAGSVWVSETVSGTGLSFHAKYSLAPDRAELEIEVRVLNRAFQELSYNGAFAFQMGDGEAIRRARGATFYSKDRDAGFWAEPVDCLLDGFSFANGEAVISRFAEPRSIGPRQLDTFRLKIVPFSGLGGLSSANSEAAGFVSREAIAVQSATQRLGHRLLVLTQSGQTLEANVDLYPERPLKIPASDFPEPVTALVLQDGSKREVLRVDEQEPPFAAPPKFISTNETRSVGPDASEDELRRLTFDPAYRHLAHTLLGYQALADKRYERAEHCFEQALLYNAEDHLVWWAKAMAARLRLGPGEENAELLNAHYLAPLEPALRAEGFLSQSQEMGREANPLLAPLADMPEQFVEVAALLVEMGLNDQATRWIDEALRHVDLPMLRYLQAYCFLRASRMHVEAAEHLAAAGRIGFVAPYPWRAIERQALDKLHERFPNDETLTRYTRLIGPISGS